MKIISWNCNGAFRKKLELMDALSPDILVVQECEDPKQSASKDYKDWAKNYLWLGHNKNKGIGVFCKSNIKIEMLNWPVTSLELFLPCRINDEFNLIAVWTKRGQLPDPPYIGQFWKYLQLNRNRFVAEKSLIIGDFNSNVIWDKPTRKWNHSDVVAELEQIQIHSLYHQQHGQSHGKETAPTLFMQRNLQRPYHIDYAFASEDLLDKTNCSIEVGTAEGWLKYSDHMPLIIRKI